MKVGDLVYNFRIFEYGIIVEVGQEPIRTPWSPKGLHHLVAYSTGQHIAPERDLRLVV